MRHGNRTAALALLVVLWLVGASTAAFAATPAPDVISPHQNQSFTSAPITAVGIGNDSTIVEVWENGDVVGSGLSDGSGIFEMVLDTGGFGSHTIRARQLGPDLAWSAFSPNITYTTDVAPVAPSFTAPAAGAVLAARPVTVSGNADSGSTVTIKEGSTTLASGLAVTNRVWSTQLNLADGAHTLAATVTDSKGRTSTTSSITFTIDTTAPAAPSIGAPSSGAALGSTSVTVSGNAEANATVRVFEGTTLRGTTTAAANGAWSVTATFGQGNRCVTARATDAAGNQGVASSSRCFVVDTVAPSVAISTADNSVFLPGATVVAGSASDNHKLARIELSYAPVTGPASTHDASTCSACGTTSGTWSDAASSLGAGVYTVTARAVDAAGNRSAPASIKIVVL